MNYRKTVAVALFAILAFLASTTLQAGQSKSESAAVEFEFVTSSFLGSADFDDSVVGARIQSDGTIVIAANLGPTIAHNVRTAATGDTAGNNGYLLHLLPNGKKVRSLRAVAPTLSDMAIDAADNIYLAAQSDGFLKLSPDGTRVIFKHTLGDCKRIDAGADGNFAAIDGKTIHIYDLKGNELGTAKGGQFTNDVCVDAASKTVAFCGFRNANAFDGNRRYPVQICYIHGLKYDGTRKWTNYDWSTDTDSDRFLNKPTNNMADSRADRCAIGRDGKLYVTFQVAGGNHIFRYSPKDIMSKVDLAGGDKYHQFYNSRAEHKNVFIRYEPSTGDFLAGQQFCGRLSSGRANAVVTKEGEINADEDGRVYLVGTSAYGIPVNLNPHNDYMGGGFLLIMSSDLKTRLVCTRTSGGKGAPHAVDARTIDGKLRVVFAGGRVPKDMFVMDAIQAEGTDEPEGKNDPSDGFFAVLKNTASK